MNNQPKYARSQKSNRKATEFLEKPQKATEKQQKGFGNRKATGDPKKQQICC